VYSYSNGTSQNIPISTVGITYLKVNKQVTGAESENPPWPNWLTPRILEIENFTEYTPLQIDQEIPPSHTYEVKHEYTFETGAQTWTNTVTNESGRRQRRWYSVSFLTERIYYTGG
jgi:hypothetical protein